MNSGFATLSWLGSPVQVRLTPGMMGADANMQVPNASRSREQVVCPHLVWRNVLGTDAVRALLDHVLAREGDFRPGIVRSRKTGEARVDCALRDCLHLNDLGMLRDSLTTLMGVVAARAASEFQLGERTIEPKEFEITAYRDGGRFGAHIDTDERLSRIRILSCVYYFAATPRRFSGGELRLYNLPSFKAAAAPRQFVDIVPETDTLVVFPSWLRHEVLPVRVPSGLWPDGRFTVNCWFHRVNPTAANISR